jgi:protein TonB
MNYQRTIKMRLGRLLVCMSLTLFFCQATAQNQLEEKVYEEVNPFGDKGSGFSLVEKWPMYPNGQQGINDHIVNTLHYPKQALQDSIYGRVIVRYVVQLDGSIGEVVVVEKVHPLIDEEAVRVIKLMKKWKPGRQKGVPVKTAYQQPINFKL